MDFDSALLAVQQGKSDMVMAGVSVTDDRLLVMDFTDSYATGVQVVIVKEGSDVTLDNLGEKTDRHPARHHRQHLRLLSPRGRRLRRGPRGGL